MLRKWECESCQDAISGRLFDDSKNEWHARDLNSLVVNYFDRDRYLMNDYASHDSSCASAI